MSQTIAGQYDREWAWEDSLGPGHPLTKRWPMVSNLQSFAQKVVQGEGWPCTLVLVGVPSGNSRADYDYDTHVASITLNVEHFTKWSMLHELAHISFLVHGSDEVAAYHGPRFEEEFLRLLDKYGKVDISKFAMPSWRDRGEHPAGDVIIAPDLGRARNNSYMVYVGGQPHARRPSLAEAKATVESTYGPQQWVKVKADQMPHHDPVWGATTMFNDAPYYLVVEHLTKAAAQQEMHYLVRVEFGRRRAGEITDDGPVSPSHLDVNAGERYIWVWAADETQARLTACEMVAAGDDSAQNPIGRTGDMPTKAEVVRVAAKTAAGEDHSDAQRLYGKGLDLWTGYMPFPVHMVYSNNPNEKYRWSKDALGKALASPHFEDFDPRELVATQGSVTKVPVRFYMRPGNDYERTGVPFADPGQEGNQRPVVYVFGDGTKLILSGHHRAVAALLKGEPLNAIRVDDPGSHQARLRDPSAVRGSFPVSASHSCEDRQGGGGGDGSQPDRGAAGGSLERGSQGGRGAVHAGAGSAVGERREAAYGEDLIARGLNLGVKKPLAIKIANETVTAQDFVNALNSLTPGRIGVWWGIMGRFGDISDFEDYAWGSGDEELTVKKMLENGDFNHYPDIDGECQVVLIAKRPTINGKLWDPETDNPLEMGGLMGNSYLPDGQPIDMVEIRYDGGWGWKSLNAQGIRTHAATEAPDEHWRPTNVMYGVTQDHLDPRIFNLVTEIMRDDVRAYGLNSLDAFWRPKYGDWTQWAVLYLAGSGASYWWSGDSDLDFLIGVDLEKLRAARPANKEVSDEDIIAHLNHELITDLRPSMAAYQPDAGDKPMEVTYFVNPGSYDIRQIHPYAAYNVSSNQWVVRPPEVSGADEATLIPDSVWRMCEQAAREAEQVLSLSEPYRTVAGIAMFDWVHEGRQVAYSPNGQGWLDPGNVIYRYLEQHPRHLLRGLYLCKHPEDATQADIDDGAATHLVTATSLSLENVISVAEEVMERGHLDGPTFDVPAPSLSTFSDGVWGADYKAAVKPASDFINRVLTENGHRGGIRIYQSSYDMEGAQAATDGMNSIQVKRTKVNALTLLHECAHILLSTLEGEGHSRRFVDTAAGLYSRYISPAAGQKFLEVVNSVTTAKMHRTANLDNSLIREILAAKPWLDSKTDDVMNGRIRGLEVDPNISAGLAGHAYLDNKIVLAPSWAKDNEFGRFMLLTHEIGHSVSVAKVQALPDYKEVFGEGFSIYNPWYASNTMPSEVIANAYSEICMNGVQGTYEDPNYGPARMLRMVAEVAKAQGMPVGKVDRGGNLKTSASQPWHDTTMPISELRTMTMAGHRPEDLSGPVVDGYVEQIHRGDPLDPIFVHGTPPDDLYMTDGHHRLAAGVKAGLTEMPVRIFDNTTEGLSAGNRALFERDQKRTGAMAPRDRVHFVLLDQSDPEEAYRQLLATGAKSLGHEAAPFLPVNEWDRDVMHSITKDHGFSFHDHPGDGPQSGYMVSVDRSSENVVPIWHLSSKYIADYMALHQAQLADPTNYLGGWVYKGNLYLDISKHVPDRQTALDLAKQHHQLGIYDLGDHETVMTDSGLAA